MYRVLRPGGAALVNVAALNMLRGNHSVVSAELRRYTRATLRALMERAGFKVVRLTYTNAALLPVMLPVRIAQRIVGLETDPEEAQGEITVPSRAVNSVLTAALAVEARALRFINMPLGSSVLCLARKPGNAQ
jgi:hypothetical protein